MAGRKRNARVASEEAASREKRGRASRSVPLPSAWINLSCLQYRPREKRTSEGLITTVHQKNFTLYIRMIKHLHTWRVATNWIVLTNAREEPASKLCLTVSTKCVASSLISTNTYSILIPFVESMGTVKVSTEIITLDYSFPNNQSSNPGGGGSIPL